MQVHRPGPGAELLNFFLQRPPAHSPIELRYTNTVDTEDELQSLSNLTVLARNEPVDTTVYSGTGEWKRAGVRDVVRGP